MIYKLGNNLHIINTALKQDHDTQWKITWNEYIQVDTGNGITIGTSHRLILLTPTEVHESADGTHQGQPYKNSDTVTLLDTERRDAISVLLPRLKGLSGVYSLSPYVDDEGSHSETLTVEFGDEVFKFRLEQGSSNPNPPTELVALYMLVTGNKLLP
jgi:hypothetical protein